MWKASAGARINTPDNNNDNDDDWETDPDFINNVTEQEQRWGSKTIEGSGRTVGAIDMNQLREDTCKGDAMVKEKLKSNAPNASYGYGGKFGIEQDRMDRSAVGHDYVAKVEKHVSQTDYSTGFGGKFGIQNDRVDKSAVSWNHKESIEKHASQRDYSSGFGGKFGVERDRQDKSAVGWDYIEKPHKHDSQKVGKPSNDGVEEQVQKPSLLKAKFENLAKQNTEQVKPPRKFKEPIKISKNEETRTSEIIPTSIKKVETKVEVSQPKHLPEPVNTTVKNSVVTQETVKEELAEDPVVELLSPSGHQDQHQHEEEHLPVEQQQQLYEQVTEVENIDNAEEISDSPYTAFALYDYQAAADDEISFDPDDIITNIEMIDEGWWRGKCNNKVGLFPANYVQILNQ